MTIHIAIQDRHLAMARLPNGQKVTKAEAETLGYTIARDSAHADQIRGYAADASAAGSTYLDAVLALPEAKERPRAAACVASAYSFKSMSLKDASLFLSGLDSELEPAAPVAKARTPAEEAKLRRVAEISVIGLGRKAGMGDAAAKSRLVSINYALRINASSATVMSACLRAVNINPDSIK